MENDLINRQAAIDAVKHAWAKGLEPTQFIEDLPSAQPEHSEGLYVDGYNDGYRDGMKDAQPNIEEDEDIPMEYFENGGI